MEDAPRGWATLDAEVARIIATECDEPFTEATIAQIKDFLKYLRGRTPVPMVGKGYWSTLQVWWDDNVWSTAASAQFEIFDTRVEVYKFDDGRVIGIRYIEHVAGESFPADLDDDLPKNFQLGRAG
jgi:hypothetical protein